MAGFVRLSREGLGSLEDWGVMPADDLIAGVGHQRGYLWLDDERNGLMVGVWACSPMTGRMGPWSTNEVMLLIEGSVAIDHEDGSTLDVTAGEAFFIPKGIVCSWRQEGELKKFFVIHADPAGPAAADPGVLRAQKIAFADHLVPCDGPDPSLLNGPAPQCAEAVAFTDVTGQLTAGIWSATPYQRTAVASGRHELMHILEGAATLFDASGREETFSAGDTVFVPQGAVVGWSSATKVRKMFCSFTPAA